MVFTSSVVIDDQRVRRDSGDRSDDSSQLQAREYRLVLLQTSGPNSFDNASAVPAAKPGPAIDSGPRLAIVRDFDAFDMLEVEFGRWM
ncbi:hypothetical protein [Amycolatopsis camponoti]|uniref:hypothetical protein n=1 Tax=Amycolatopsis camponoti TaxID=2606593 RepID=UPI0012D74CAC|nr:hypothetical protein [Amycolatopsis camponoti]